MRKTNNKTWKRVAAGALSMALVAGALPANVGGLLTGGSAIVAHAATLDSRSTIWSEDSNITDNVIINGGVTVSADMTLTIPSGMTLTVNGGINANGKTLTVTGAGTLTVTGTNGADGEGIDVGEPGNGSTGGAGFTGTLVVDGATVNVTGGNGGNGGSCFMNPVNSGGGAGGNGGYGVSGNVTVNSGSFTANGGNGGNGGYCDIFEAYGSAGSEGQAVSGTISAATIEESDNNHDWSNVDGTSSTKRYVKAETDEESFDVSSDDLIEGIDYTAPTAVAGLSYDGEDHALVTGGMTDAGAAKGTMKFRKGAWAEGDNIEWDTTVLVGDVIKPTGESGITLPSGGFKIAVGENTGYLIHAENDKFVISKRNERISINDAPLAGNYDALKVTGIDHTNKIVTVTPINSEAEVWSTDAPTATNAGYYNVSWKIAGATGYNDVAPQTITATIAKAALTEKHFDDATQEIVGDYTAPTAAKTLKTEATLTEPDEYYDDLFYTGNSQALINAGTVAQGKGTMQYALDNRQERNSRDVYDPVVGDVIKPTGTDGLFFPHGYSIRIGENTYNNNSNKGINIYISPSTSPKSVVNSDYDSAIEYAWRNSGKDALRITAVDDVNKAVTIEFVDYATAITWQDTIPTAKDIGTYNVAWRITGNDNYETVSGTIENEIKMKPADLVLSNLDVVEGEVITKAAVITKADGTKLDPKTGSTYTLTGGTYYLYSDKSVADADTTGSIASFVGQNKTLGDKTYAFKYELTVPTLPADEGYILSHNNNWTGVVPTTDESKLYVADGVVDTEDESQLAAVLQSTGTFYYGDQPSEANVKINNGFGSIITVKDVYLSNDQGTKLDLTSGNVPFGNYKLTAKVVVDSDGDDDLTTGTLKTCTLYADVVYAARPMSENKYFLKTKDTAGADVETPLELKKADDGSYYAEVPAATFTYDGTAKKPEIIVKNGSNTTVLTDTDYTSDIAEKTDAGSYSFALTAPAENGKPTGNYSDKVTVKWSIAKAKAKVTAAAKTGITYDGAALDASDFDFTAAANDTLAAQVISEMTAAQGQTPKTTVAVTGVTETENYIPFTNIIGDSVDHYLFYSGLNANAGNMDWYHVIRTDKLESGAYIKLPGYNGLIPVSAADYISVNSVNRNFVIKNDGTLEYSYRDGIYSTALTEGNGWYLKKTENYPYGEENVTLYEVVQQKLPTKTYDLKNAGTQKAKLTINNPNITVTVNNGEAVEAAIAKKKVTITPAEGQKAVFGQIKTVDDANSTADDKFFAPDYTFDGVVDADKAAITTFGDILDVKYNKTASGETKADVTKYGAAKQYIGTSYLNYALTQSNRKLWESQYYSIDGLSEYVTDLTTITIADGTTAGYTFDYSNREKAIKDDEDYPGWFHISSDTLKYKKSTINGAEVNWDNEVTSVSLGSGNVWVVTGELYTAAEIAEDGNLDGKYKSIEIKQVPVTESVDFVNAGTYQFMLDTTQTADNYTFELAQDASTYVIEQKSLKSADISLTVSTPTYTYDGTKKDAPTNYVIKDAQVGTLAKDKDFEVGGQTAAALPNTYNLEYSGLGNYTDMITSVWTIQSDKTYQATVKVENKTYDGNAVSARITYQKKNGQGVFEDTNDTPKSTKTTYTYYEWDNTALPTAAELAALTPLTGAPTDAGNYLVVAKTTARGYEIPDSMAAFKIEKKAISLIPKQTTIEYGKWDTFDLTEYTYSIADILDGDEVTVSGDLALANPVMGVYGAAVGEYNYDVTAIKVDNKNYKVVANDKLTVTKYELTDESIKVTGRCAADADGWAYPNDCIKVVANLYNTETEKYEEVELKATTDFTITSATKTKQLGGFNVEVEGKGNYTTDPIAVAEVDVVTFEELLGDYYEFTEQAPQVAINNTNKVIGVRLGFSGGIKENTLGLTVEEYGIIYNRDGSVNDISQLTYDASSTDKNSAIVRIENRNAQNIVDYGKGVIAVGYAKVKDNAGNEAIVYSENIGGNTYVCTEAAPIAVNNPNTGAQGVKVQFEGNIYKTGYSVKEYGLLFSNDGTKTVADLKLDKVDESIRQRVGKNAQNIADNGNGVVAVGYMIIQNTNGDEAVIYTGDLGGKYSELAIN